MPSKKYILKQYKEWINDAKEYWTNEINNSMAPDDDKSNMLSQLEDYLSQFETTVENYKKTFTKSKFRTALSVYIAAYTFDQTDIYQRYPKFKRPNIKPFTQVVQYYTYELCSIENAFSIEQETDQTTGMTHYVLNMADLQKDIDNIQNMNEDKNVSKNITEPANDCLTEIGFVLAIKNLKYRSSNIIINEQILDKLSDFQTICSDFGFEIPYITN